MRHLKTSAIAALFTLGLTAAAQAGEQYIDRSGAAVGGYDVTTYHSAETPVEGLEDITAEHNGAVWRFASEDNRERFLADPEAFIPAYDGHCAYAPADGRKVRTDPLAYRVVDGVLYLNFDRRIQRRWEEDIPGYLEQSEANWPELEPEPAARPSRWF
jgi:hypothetical protein